MAKKRKRKLKKGPIVFLLLIVLIALSAIFVPPLLKDSKTVKKDNNTKKVVKKQEEPKEKKMSLVAVGDTLIHGAVFGDAQTGANTYDFSGMIADVKPLIEKYDIKYFNQESIIGGKNLGVSHYPMFNSPDEIGDNMVDLGFNMVTTANNHTFDKGEAGILYTNEYWKNKGIVHAGTYSSQEERDKVKVYEQNGIKYGLLSYTTVTNGMKAPQGKEYLVNVYSDELAKQDIEGLKNEGVDVIIVAMHWGEEYIVDPVEEQKDIAKYLSDLGVNLIIGTHPHIIEPVGYINDTLVIYSLGNFISGQSPMGIDKIVGLMVGMDIIVKDNKVTFNNIDYKLLYTYCTSNYKNYKVIPFDSLDDATLQKYGNYTVQGLKDKYMEIVNREVNYGN